MLMTILSFVVLAVLLYLLVATINSGISRDIMDRRNHIHYVQDYTRTS